MFQADRDENNRKKRLKNKCNIFNCDRFIKFNRNGLKMNSEILK